MKFIDAEKLKAHIQYLIKKDNYELFDVPELLSFIDSLQHEQCEIDLEKEIDLFVSGWTIDAFLGLTDDDGWSVTVEDVKNVARHFYELGRNSRNEE